MKDIKDRILDVAIELAEEGGFENVRQRDVAAKAGVALGTLYKRFRSKEDILSAALDREASLLERRMEKRPVRGPTPLERVGIYYAGITRGLCRKPHLARAMLRAMASGEPEIATNVSLYTERMQGLVIAAMRGVGRLTFSDGNTVPATNNETRVAVFLQHVWFASLVGWSAGLHPQSTVVEHVTDAAALLVAGLGEPLYPGGDPVVVE